MLKNIKKHAFYKDKDMSILSKVFIQKIVKHMIHNYYEEGTLVFVRNEPANKLIIVLQGLLADVFYFILLYIYIYIYIYIQ